MIGQRQPGKPSRAVCVLLYSINYAPEVMGIGRYAGELGAYIQSLDVALEVVTSPPHYPGWRIQSPHRNRYSTERLGASRITRCPLVLSRRMGGLWRILVALSFAASSAPVILWRALRTRPDVVLATEPTLLAAPVALLAARLCGARAILHVQDLEVEAAFAVGHVQGRGLLALARAFDRAVLRRFDHVVTISGRMRARILEMGVAPARLSLVRNWVDLKAIHPSNTESPFRREWGLDPKCFVVLYAGNIGAKQALHEVIEAAARLQDCPEVQFVIAGEGPEKAALMATATSNVRFIPLQPEVRLRDLLCAADLHVLPQNPDAADLVLPSKLGGMLASGRPLLVQAATGTELYDFLAGAAEIVPPGNAGRLAEAIRDRRPDLAETAARRALLAADLAADRILPVFARLLQLPNAAPAAWARATTALAEVSSQQ